MLDFPKPLPKETLFLLIRAAQSGNGRAMELAILYNMRLVACLAGSISRRFPKVELDDLIQEGALAIHRCVLRFDVCRDLEFSTYAHVSVSRGLSGWANRESAKASDIVEFIPDAEWSLDNYERPFEPCEGDLSRVREALSRIDERDRLVLEARVYGNRTLRSLSDELGVCRERVRQLEAKGLKAIADQLGCAKPSGSIGWAQ